jgi:hypothetical protein
MTNEFTFDNAIKSVGNSIEFLTEKGDYTLSLYIIQDEIENRCDIHLSISDISTALILFSKSLPLHNGPPIPFTQARLNLDWKLMKHKTYEELYNDCFYITPERIFESTIYLGAYVDEYNNHIPKEMIDRAYEIMMALYNNQSLNLTGKEKQCAEKISIDILL